MIYHHKSLLRLRKLDRGDLDCLFRIKSGAWTTMHGTPFLNRGDQESWFEGAGEDEFHLVAEREGEPPAGWVFVGYGSLTRLCRIAGTASVTMMASPPERGTSWCRRLPEAITDFGFEALNLRRLEAEVLDNNPAALLFDLEVGYKIEGRRRQAVYKCGRYHDSLLIALLRTEWEATDRVRNYGGACNSDYKERKPIERAIRRYQGLHPS